MIFMLSIKVRAGIQRSRKPPEPEPVSIIAQQIQKRPKIFKNPAKY
jgi:hypothetical protein